jgi:hypothetical protein
MGNRYDPDSLTRDLCRLIFGVLMILSASFAIKKVREGSKNKFAFVLLSFTVITGISYIGLSLNDAFKRKV